MRHEKIKWVFHFLIFLQCSFARSEYSSSLLVVRDAFRGSFDRKAVEVYCVENKDKVLSELADSAWLHDWGDVVDADIAFVTALLKSLFNDSPGSVQQAEASWLCAYRTTLFVTNSGNTNAVLRLGFLFRLHKVATELDKTAQTDPTSENRTFVAVFIVEEAKHHMVECRKKLLEYTKLHPAHKNQSHEIFAQVSGSIEQYLNTSIDAFALYAALEKVLSHSVSSDEASMNSEGYSVCNRAEACSKILSTWEGVVSESARVSKRNGLELGPSLESKDSTPAVDAETPTPNP